MYKYTLGSIYVLRIYLFFFFKQKTAYEMRISDWSSDVCSSDLIEPREVSAGYRFGNDGVSEFADIFIYDTLAGGAGYALQTGESFAKVFDMAKTQIGRASCRVRVCQYV